MKKVFSLLITLAMLISTMAVPVSASDDATAWDGTTIDTEWEGTGTETDPYLIGSAAELAGLSEKVWNAVDNKTNTVDATMTGNVVASKTWQVAGNSVYNVYKDTYFKLTADIDLDEKEWQPIGRSGARFSGKFDGDGHVIKNVSINKPYIGIGLFGATGITAEIKNLGLENFKANVYSSPYGSGHVLDVTEFGNSMNINYIWGSGAMVGIVGGGEFKDSYVKNATFVNSTTYSGEAGFGGFAGNFIMADDYSEHTAKFTNCYTMNVTATVADQAAGFAAKIGGYGDNRDVVTEFKNCYVGGNLTLSSAKNEIGGFAIEVRDKATLTNCHTTYSSDRAGATVNATKESITTAFATANGYVADNTAAFINSGYPVLSWQADWIWNGTVATGFAGGSGTENDPYLISNGAQLAYLADTIWNAEGTTDTALKSTMKNWRISVDGSATQDSYDLWGVYDNTYFKLTADIDLNNVEWKPIGRNRARFAGIFDGDGHIVKNVKITKVYNGTGFFGATAHTAVVKNLGLEKVDIAVACSNTSEDFKEFGNNEDKWHNGVVALAAPVAYSAGNTVKVFVWDSMEALTPVADAYSTTL